MKKPNWRFRFYKNSRWYWVPSVLRSPLLWKEKHNIVRIELIPTILFTWGNWSLEWCRGTEKEWEFYIWCTKYCNGNVQQAIDTWPWGRNIAGTWVRTHPLN